MITDAIIHFVLNILVPFLAFLPKLPTLHVTTWDARFSNIMGGVLHFVSPIVPVTVLVDWLDIFFIILPVIGAYIVAQWIWDHIPLIAGFGTG